MTLLQATQPVVMQTDPIGRIIELIVALTGLATAIYALLKHTGLKGKVENLAMLADVTARRINETSSKAADAMNVAVAADAKTGVLGDRVQSQGDSLRAARTELTQVALNTPAPTLVPVAPPEAERNIPRPPLSGFIP